MKRLNRENKMLGPKDYENKVKPKKGKKGKARWKRKRL